LFIGFGRSGKAWLGVALSASIVIAGSVVATAAVTGKHHANADRGPIICRKDGRRTIKVNGVYYWVRNDIIHRADHQCIRLVRQGQPGFVVIKTQANSVDSSNDAFPEVLYGCEWSRCTNHTVLPRRIWQLKSIVSSWDATWRRAHGQFNVAWDIWFGVLHTINGHANGAELMIWLGVKHFPTPHGVPIVRIDGIRWYYAHHRACSIYGCWKYILFRRVRLASHAHHLRLLAFFRYAERKHLLRPRWFLKSVDVGFEIWHKGLGLAIHRYSVRIKLRPARKHNRVRK
jgi:hypothetical protein